MAAPRPLRAPFPWMGGKGRVAPLVWQALGDVRQYIEPFAGSLAVLLQRPDEHRAGPELANDMDGFVTNFWRAAAWRPDEVVEHAKWPINEVDRRARNAHLNRARDELTVSLIADPEWCDPRAAGWWLWGVSASIDSNADFGSRSEAAGREKKTKTRPKVNGVQGVHASADPKAWLEAIATRLYDPPRRHVMILCDDWSRCVTDGALAASGAVGVFLDPPYDPVRRNMGYAADDPTLSRAVRRWCLDHADDPRVRIVLAGLEGEHRMPSSWPVLEWSSTGGIGTSAAGSSKRRHQERLWLSPHCLPVAV